LKIFKRGFTFLEIMTAIGIFGIVAVACLTNYLTCVKNIKVVNDKIQFLTLSEQKIQELKLSKEEIQETTGYFPDSEFTWCIELSDEILYDTVEEIEFIPYKLIIEGHSDTYSSLLPFLKVKKKNE